MTDIKKSWQQEADKRKNTDQEFEAWFDDAKTYEETKANAIIDFYQRILTPSVYKWLGDPRGKTCLEIGCGSGRLMAAALNVFKNAIGIDLHTQDVFKRVSEKLSKIVEPTQNYNLVHRDNAFSIPEASVDFVYSFIVFQHFDSVDEVKRYFEILKHVMKPGAVGRIFFMEGETQTSFAKFASNPRIETLYVSTEDMKLIAQENGMIVRDCDRAGPKKVWQPLGILSSQHVITFTRAVS